MYIEELKGAEEGEFVLENGEEENLNLFVEKTSVLFGSKIGRGSIVVSGTKRVLVGAGARALFYPTLLYNVVRNKFQAEFRWWDRVDEFLLLGAVPFPADVPRLKGLGVGGVVTLNEPYETLVPTSLYHAHSIDHLVIPTRDYCFAPSLSDISLAVDFIHVMYQNLEGSFWTTGNVIDDALDGKYEAKFNSEENSLSRQMTYVHCKAGRGRSTTIVICYLVHHKEMTPDSAYDYVRSIRPRVLLASAQWQAVLDYYHLRVNKPCVYRHVADQVFRAPRSMTTHDCVAFDDSSVVVVTESDLDGYDSSLVSSDVGSEIWADLSVVYRVRVAGQAALARISCLWFRCHTQQKVPGNKLGRVSSCSISADHLGGISVDIHVY